MGKWRSGGKTTIAVNIFDLCTKITKDGLAGVVAVAEGSTTHDLNEVFEGLEIIYERRIEYIPKEIK